MKNCYSYRGMARKSRRYKVMAPKVSGVPLMIQNHDSLAGEQCVSFVCYVPFQPSSVLLFTLVHCLSKCQPLRERTQTPFPWRAFDFLSRITMRRTTIEASSILTPIILSLTVVGEGSSVPEKAPTLCPPTSCRRADLIVFSSRASAVCPLSRISRAISSVVRDIGISR